MEWGTGLPIMLWSPCCIGIHWHLLTFLGSQRDNVLPFLPKTGRCTLTVWGQCATELIYVLLYWRMRGKCATKFTKNRVMRALSAAPTFQLASITTWSAFHNHLHNQMAGSIQSVCSLICFNVIKSRPSGCGSGCHHDDGKQLKRLWKSWVTTMGKRGEGRHELPRWENVGRGTRKRGEWCALQQC